MADFNNSPQMNLPVPTVGIAGGPLWATLLDACMARIDGHDHTSGNGAAIPSAALNINADLSMIGNNLTNIRTLRFATQSSVANPTDLGVLYEIGDDLYYTDGIGQQIRITQGGSVTGSTGTITGLPSGTASASYNALSATFVFQSATNIAANIDGGNLLLRNLSPNSTFAVTLQAPTALGSNYALTMPQIPATQSFMTLDNSGNMAAPWTVDGSTLEISGGTTLQVKASGITTTQLADNAVTSNKILNDNVTLSKIPLNVAVSSSSGSFSTASTSPQSVVSTAVTSTTTNRPIEIRLQSDGAAGVLGVMGASGTSPLEIILQRNGTTIASYGVSGTSYVPVSSFNFLDTGVTSTGVYTYALKANRGNTGSGSAVFISNAVLVVRQY